jgi:hypothetical protein
MSIPGRFQSRRRLRLVAGAALLGALVTATAGSGPFAAAARLEATGTSNRAVAHHAGGKVVKNAKHLPMPVLYDTKHGAGEPTIGFTADGTMFYAAADIDSEPTPNQIDILRSTDGGRTWEEANPAVGPQKTHPVTLDPYLYVDEAEAADRVYTIDLTVACSDLSYSDDGGATWTTNPMACGVPINDHQTLFSGPPASSLTVGYPSVVYYCFNDIASSSCTKSLDGGLSFIPAGTPPYEGSNGSGVCGGLNGHGTVGPDGTVYLPREYCGKPFLAISHDEGATWTQVDVSGGKLEHPDGPDPSVKTDSAGNIYYVWIAEDRLPYLAISTDSGETWGKPLMIAAPGVKEANLPTIDVGVKGKVAITYMGSTNSQGKPWNNTAELAKTTWNGYITMSTSVLRKNPLFYSASVNNPRDPIQRGRCGPGRCGRVFDFIDINISPAGEPFAAFVDACTAKCAKRNGVAPSGDEGIVGGLVGGPRLR